MQRSDIPARLALPFANSGSKNTIPTAPSPTPGLASLELGFPPVTMTPIVAGGIPPSGMDFNGILYSISAASRWAMAGAMYTYNADFASAVGGYPAGAILLSASGTNFWLNLADNNETDPDDGGTDWMPVISNSASASAPGIIQLANSGQAAAGLSQTLGMTPFTTAGLFPFRGIQVYDTAGAYTWTVPEGVTKAWVTIVGGGGGSGRNSSTASGGGSGGGAAFKLVDLTGIASVEITVGAGGVGRTGSQGNGSPGGVTSFGTIFSATGGSGGNVAPGRPPSGLGVGGDINITGSTADGSSPSNGGESIFGGRGAGASSSSNSGDAGKAPGAGAGGSASGVDGSDGAAGIVIVQW